jgi:3-hydroxy-D-aspartate aldolase
MDSYSPEVGTPINQLDTPCLLIDLAALENNFQTVSRQYDNQVCKMRQHAKNIKSAVVARKQINTGGTVGGVCCAKVSEAEVMVDGGVNDVLITNQIVTTDKIRRMCDLAAKADVKVAVDNPINLQELSSVATMAGVNIGVVIEVDTSMGRAGVRNPEEGIELAKLASNLPGLVFRGVMSHQTLGSGEHDKRSRENIGKRYIQVCLDVKNAIEACGIPVEIVSSGETFTYDIATAIPGVTEVQGGTYALMAHGHAMAGVFETAGKILASVMSITNSGEAVVDVGYRALTSPSRLPAIIGSQDMFVDRMEEYHLMVKSKSNMSLVPGDKLLLEPAVQDIMANRWDNFIVVRNDKVEAIWGIDARGCVQ